MKNYLNILIKWNTWLHDPTSENDLILSRTTSVYLLVYLISKVTSNTNEVQDMVYNDIQLLENLTNNIIIVSTEQ